MSHIWKCICFQNLVHFDKKFNFWDVKIVYTTSKEHCQIVRPPGASCFFIWSAKSDFFSGNYKLDGRLAYLTVYLLWNLANLPAAWIWRPVARTNSRSPLAHASSRELRLASRNCSGLNADSPAWKSEAEKIILMKSDSGMTIWSFLCLNCLIWGIWKQYLWYKRQL